MPPWVPTIPASPSTSNFVAWQSTLNINSPADGMVRPTHTLHCSDPALICLIQALSYCRPLNLTINRNGNRGSSPDSHPAATFAASGKQESMRMNRAESIGKLGKGQSRKASFSGASIKDVGSANNNTSSTTVGSGADTGPSSAKPAELERASSTRPSLVSAKSRYHRSFKKFGRFVMVLRNYAYSSNLNASKKAKSGRIAVNS
jgi:hypothetical protein